MLTLACIHFSYLGLGLFVLGLKGMKPQLTKRLSPGTDEAERKRLSLGGGGVAGIDLSKAYLCGLTLQIAVLYAAVRFAPVAAELSIGLTVLGLIALVWRAWTHRGALATTLRHLAPRRQLLRTLPDLVLIPPLLLIALLGTGVPVASFDGVAIWGTKALYLFNGEHLTSEAFTDSHRAHAHPGYPLLLPLFLNQHFVLEGAPDEMLAKRGLWVLTMIGVLLFHQLVRRWSGHAAATLATGVLLFAPVISTNPQGGSPTTLYADFPLAVFILASAGLFLRYLEDNTDADLAACAAALAAAVLVKGEGALWLFVFLPCAVGAAFAAGRRPTGRQWAILATPLAALALMKAAHAGLPPSSDIQAPSPSEVVGLVSTVPSLIGLMVESSLDYSRWGMLPWTALAGFAAGLLHQRRNPCAILALCAPALLAVDLTAMGLTEVQLGLFDYYAQYTFPRLLIQLTPVSLFFAVVLNGSEFPGRRRARAQAPGDAPGPAAEGGPDDSTDSTRISRSPG